jgi:hypothetical protein
MDQKKLQLLFAVSSVVLLAVLAGSFITVVLAALGTR